MGPPGSGKGTQAALLAKKFGFTHLSTGQLIREMSASGRGTTVEAAEIAKFKIGGIVGDWLIYNLVFREIKKNLVQGSGVVLDGAIRTINQAREFIKFFKEKDYWKNVKVIWIKLSDEDSLRRLHFRRVCSKCGENIPYTKETKNLEFCPKCGGRLIKRADDINEDIFKRRLEEQGEKIVASLVEEFKKEENTPGAIVKEVDGSGEIEKVNLAITDFLN